MTDVTTNLKCPSSLYTFPHLCVERLTCLILLTVKSVLTHGHCCYLLLSSFFDITNLGTWGKKGGETGSHHQHRHTSIYNNQNNDFNYFRIVFGISIRLKFHKCNLTLTFFKRNFRNISPLCHSCHCVTDKTSASLFRKVSHYLFLHLYSELFTVGACS